MLWHCLSGMTSSNLSFLPITYMLDVLKNLVDGSEFFTMLGCEFGHLMGTTWSSET